MIIIIHLSYRYTKIINNYKDKCNRQEALINDLNELIDRNNTDNKMYMDTISDLKDENKKLTILSKVSNCNVCGKRDISVEDDEYNTTISCNYCHTIVNLDKSKAVSSDDIIKVWNGLNVKILD
jgi:transcription elongation factor Elf1